MLPLILPSLTMLICLLPQRQISQFKAVLVMLSFGSGQIHMATLALVIFLIAENDFRIPLRYPVGHVIGALAFLSFVIFLALYNGINPRVVNEFVQLVLYFILFFLMYHYLSNARNVRTLLLAMCYTSLIVAAVGLLNYFTGWKAAPHIFPYRGGNETSTFLALMGAISASTLFVKNKSIWPLLALFIFLVAAYYATSRANIVIIALSLAVSLLYLFKHRLIRLLIIFIVIAFAGYETKVLYDTFEGQLNYSALQRIELIEYGWELHRERPWFGWGWGTSSIIVPASGLYEYPHFHNTYIQFLVELGLMGWFIITAFFAFVLNVMVGAARRRSDHFVSVFIINASFGLFFSGFFEVMLFGADRAIQLVILLALLSRTKQLQSLSRL